MNISTDFSPWWKYIYRLISMTQTCLVGSSHLSHIVNNIHYICSLCIYLHKKIICRRRRRLRRRRKTRNPRVLSSQDIRKLSPSHPAKNPRKRRSLCGSGRNLFPFCLVKLSSSIFERGYTYKGYLRLVC